MNLRILLSFICLGLLSACVTATPDNVLSADPQTVTQAEPTGVPQAEPLGVAQTQPPGVTQAQRPSLAPTEPQGFAQKDGNYPVFGRIPVGQTTQLTPTQKAEMQAELARDRQLVERRSSPEAQTDYLAEVKRLKKLAQDRIDSLTDRIEGGENGAGSSGDAGSGETN